MLSDFASGQVQGVDVAGSLDLGAKARQVMIDIFLHKDATTIERSFTGSFVQHDPTIADGLPAGLSFGECVQLGRARHLETVGRRHKSDADRIQHHLRSCG